MFSVYTSVLAKMPTPLPNILCSMIVSYLNTPLKFKMGTSYYLSYINKHGDPVLELIHITKITPFHGRYIFPILHFTTSTFIISKEDDNTGHWTRAISNAYKHAELDELRHTFGVELSCSTPSGYTTLYSQNTTDERTAFRRCISKMVEYHRYSRWIRKYVSYFETHFGESYYPKQNNIYEDMSESDY